MTAVASCTGEPTVPSLAARATDVLAFEWVKLRSVRSNYMTLLIAAIATLGSTAVVARAMAAAAAPPPGGTITALTASFLGYAEYAVIPVSVLAVLQFTSEYATGLISTTFCAVPRRWAALAGKAAVTGAAALLAGEVLAFACFWLTQAMLSGRHRGVSLAQPGVPGAVLAGGLVLCACALTAPRPRCGHPAHSGRDHSDIGGDLRGGRALPCAAVAVEGRPRQVHHGLRSHPDSGAAPAARPAAASSVHAGTPGVASRRAAGCWPGDRPPRRMTPLPR